MGLTNPLDAYDASAVGERMMLLMERLIPMPRSITGEGFRATQRVLGELIPDLKLGAVPSGSQAFDWTVPQEWNIEAARLTGPSGDVIVDFSEHPLHVLNYSIPIEERMPLERLRPHLFCLPDQPNAIPYRTSYYSPEWGFCLPYNKLVTLEDGDYEVVIESELSDGVLNYGEWLHQGETDQEVLLTAHACHPAMCNDNLSGVVVAAFLAEMLTGRSTHLSYRVLFLPGGIGSVVWMWRNQHRLHQIVAGLTLGCLGDGAPFTYKETRRGGTLTDNAAKLAFRDAGIQCDWRPFEPYGFDERNFNSPKFDLPIGSLTRSPHGEFDGYHTSQDDLASMDSRRLGASLEMLLRIVTVLDNDETFVNLVPEAEPQLGKRGLYESIGGLKERRSVELGLLWVMNLSDGTNSLVDIALRSGEPFEAIASAARLLQQQGLLRPF